MKEIIEFSGQFIFPGDKQYDSRRKVWNGVVDRRPGAIALCKTEAEVAAAVTYARERNLPVSIRGGGHHVSGSAVCDEGIMIDLSEMRKVEVDFRKKIAYVQGGATLRDVDTETQKYGLATPTGTISETGIGGLALSGGTGYLRGMYGLTCDNIIGADVVTAAGERIHVSQQEYPDLFWAIRGGGGNFGIVTQFELQLYEVGPEVFAVDVMYDYKDAKTIFTKMNDYLESGTDEVSFNATSVTLPPVPDLPPFLHGKKVLMVAGMYAGDPAEGEAEVQPLRELAEPIVDQSGITSYTELQSKFDPMIQHHVPAYGGGLFLEKLDERTIDTVLAKIETAPLENAEMMFALWPCNGRMNRTAPDYNAFAVRDARTLMVVDIIAAGENDNTDYQGWVDSLYQDILPYSVNNGATYLNIINDTGDAVEATFADNYARLKEIKKKYDPDNTFCFNHNINP